MARIALTGATGFIGRHTATALAATHRVRALVRRPAPELASSGVELVAGELEDGATLARLCRGAEVLLHVAGAIRAPDAAAFHRVNAAASAELARVAARAGVRRFVLVSSLAARAPTVSAYGASKAAAEEMVVGAAGRDLEIIIVRPPAVYGPGDRTTFDLFRALARGLLPAPAGSAARFSLLYVEDLAALLALLASAAKAPRVPLEPDDGRPGGYGWRDVARIAAQALGRPVRLLPVPWTLAAALSTLATIAARIGGRPSPLPRDRLRQLYHPDWVCRSETMAALGSWRPQVRFEQGVLRTLAWYEAAGWLRLPEAR